MEGEVHTIILQVDINNNEKQDVAVFTVEKLKENEVRIQLVGDEDLYGKDYIVEPNYSDTETGDRPNPGYTGKVQQIEDKQVEVVTTTYVEVAAWPVVQYVYMPTYVVWRSPWYWGYYPGWWRPWRPWYWHYYYGYHYNYYSYYYGWYRPWHHHRYPHWHDHYYSRRRTHSVYVVNRRRDGAYNNTYSRPALKNDGMQLYTRDNPKAPVLKPGLNRPAPRPESRPVARPTRPGTTAPGTTGPGTTRPTGPTAKPGVTTPNKPVTRPSRPATKPGVTQPNKPATRPTRPATKPGGTQTNKPTTRPVQKPAPKPVTRPAAKPAPKPAPKQGTGSGSGAVILLPLKPEIALWSTIGNGAGANQG